MSYFPFFKEIEGEKCLVIGGGKVAARKISRLKGFGVKIKVVPPSTVSDIEAVAQSCDNISIERRTFTQEDIENVDFVIAAAGEEVDKEAARLKKEVFQSMLWISRSYAILYFLQLCRRVIWLQALLQVGRVRMLQLS